MVIEQRLITPQARTKDLDEASAAAKRGETEKNQSIPSVYGGNCHFAKDMTFRVTRRW